MLDLLNSVLFGFAAIAESHFILWIAITLFTFASFSLFNRSTTQRQSFAIALVLARRVAALGILLDAAFLVATLLMATGIDKKYYYLLFEFFSTAWLPTTLLIASLIMYAQTLVTRSEFGASKCGADQDVAPPKA
jgi:hypothetical protein